MNITIDDVSPQIQYKSGDKPYWMTKHDADGDQGKYLGGTFHSSINEGDTATVRFNGTAIEVYGARRPNHGVFTAQLDGGPVRNYTTRSENNDNQYQQVIYSAQNLVPDREHTLVITNRPSYSTKTDYPDSYTDIDYIVITQPVHEQVYTTIYDDRHSSFAYAPGLWTPSDNPITAYRTTRTGAYVDFTFHGFSAQIFGALDPIQGNFTVSVDGGEERQLYAGYHKQLLGASLFVVSGLEDGPHTIRVTNAKSPDGKAYQLDIDYAMVNSSISTAGQPGDLSSSLITSIASKISSLTASTTGSSSIAAQSATSSSQVTVGFGPKTYNPVASGQADLDSSTGEGTINGGGRAAGIALGIVGALVLIGVIIWASLRFRRREMDDRLSMSVNDSEGGRTDQDSTVSWIKEEQGQGREGGAGAWYALDSNEVTGGGVVTQTPPSTLGESRSRITMGSSIMTRPSGRLMSLLSMKR